jgi:hypothetical protein
MNNKWKGNIKKIKNKINFFLEGIVRREIMTIKRFNNYWIGLYILLTIFLIPYGYQTNNYKIFIPIFLFINLFTYLLIDNKKIKKKKFVYIILAIGIISINLNIGILEKIKYIFVLMTIMLIKKKIKINSLLSNIIYYSVFLSLFIQILIYRYNSIRRSYSIIDPNFSSIISFFFLVYCDKQGYKIGYLFSIITLFFFKSRAYFLALLLFYLVKIIKHSFKEKFLKLKINNFFVLSFISIILIYIISFIFLIYVSVENIPGKRNFNDISNKNRFLANVRVIGVLLNDPKGFFWGYGEKLEEKFIGNKPRSLYGIPHNSILKPLLIYGFFAIIIYLLIYGNEVNKRFNYENYEYIYSYFIFSMFLHSLFEMAYGIAFIYLLSLEKRNFSSGKIDRVLRNIFI